MILTCDQCGVAFEREPGQANRCARTFCSLQCAGLARRKDITDAEKVAAKAAYDREYRARNIALIQEKKRAYYQANRDPEREKAARKAKADQHRAYIKSERYRRWKAAYDQRRRDAEAGDLAEAQRLLIEIKKEVCLRVPDKYERAKARGYYDKKEVR